jgi:transcriptional regulator GlxA family with amidase domain
MNERIQEREAIAFRGSEEVGTGSAGPDFRPLASMPVCGLRRHALARVRSYVEENLGRKFAVCDVARAAGLSRSHFSRLFRASTGESPMGFAMRLRVERAKEMLLKGDHETCQIALELGFCDQSHFSRTFRRLTGHSPREYVRQCDLSEVVVIP